MTGMYSEAESPAQSKQIFRLCTFDISGVSFLNCDDLSASLFVKRSIFILLKDQVVNIFTGIM